MALAIRKYQPEDTAGVRRYVVELQEFERRIDPRLRPGEEMADIVVLPSHRGRRVGAELLQRAEAFARAAGAAELRIAVLAENTAARRLYQNEGFTPYLEVFVKPL